MIYTVYFEHLECDYEQNMQQDFVIDETFEESLKRGERERKREK